MKHKSRSTPPPAGKNSTQPHPDNRLLEGLGEDEQSQMLRKDSKQMNELINSPQVTLPFLSLDK